MPRPHQRILGYLPNAHTECPTRNLSKFYRLALLLPIFQPQLRRILTIFGVTAAVRGTRMNMKLLWMAYARASCVARAKWDRNQRLGSFLKAKPKRRVPSTIKEG